MVGKTKKKKKRPRRHFKFDLERIARHIGKIIDNAKPQDLAEVGIMLGLAYAGYEAFKDWKGLLVGPIGLKLAMAPGGTWHVSQIAGVGMLASLGVALSPVDAEGKVMLGGIPGIETRPIGPQEELIMTFGKACPEGYSQLTQAFGIRWCVRTKKS